jgi:carbon storage regulator CsrA
MLVLSRKLGEEIRISDGELTVTVIAIKGARVTLGICAPATVAIARGECEHRTPASLSPPKDGDRELRSAG